MKILVIGGVAAGTKAAAKCKRENRADEVLVITKSADISYAGCGLPYYVGGSIEDKAEPVSYTHLFGNRFSSWSKALRKGWYKSSARRKFPPAWTRSKVSPLMIHAMTIFSPPTGR